MSQSTTPDSPRRFRFGVQGGPVDDARALRAHAREIEQLGYDELFTYDHVGRPADGGPMPLVDPFAPLLIASAATTRLRVGPLVLNNELYHPALLARTAATVDRLTGGRLVLGLGTGYAADEHDRIGQPIRPVGPRVTRFRESLEILRSLLDRGTVDHDGEYEQVHIPELGVVPMQRHVPFLIGGHGRRVVRLAARHADIFQFTGLTHAEDGTPGPGGFAPADVDRRARWLTDAAGDRNGSIERSALVQFAACGPDAPPAQDLAARFSLDPDEVADSPFVLSGSVEQLTDKIGRLRERVGITHYVIRDAAGFAPVVEALGSPPPPDAGGSSPNVSF